ncbi:glycosyltransferase [Bacillus fonticola]|uniref:glycosyltransferase n=1 Tax=Bacillus fonticola TaxID=2728853 RepID=UPI001884E617|nr:glycosyltransferase [Bacillus fonticola]
MKVVLASPNFHQPRGNTVTVRRIASGLEKLGVKTDIVSITEEGSLHSFPSADIVHGFHAHHFYTFMQKLGRTLNPYIVTLTGTDLNHDLFDKSKRADVMTSLNGAKAIHVFDNKARETLLNEIPQTKNKIVTIAQGTVDFPKVHLPFAKEKNTFLFVLPAGIRKVKNIPAAIHMMQALHRKFPRVRLWLVGPIIEEEEGRLVKELVDRQSDWISYLGQLPHSSMGAVYEQADVVLNTSHSEGQSTALLEAMGYEIPVIVSNNQGNRSIVSHKETGFLYQTPDEFLEFTEQIMNNKHLKQKMGQLAKQYIVANHSNTYEAETLLHMYKRILDIK